MWEWDSAPTSTLQIIAPVDPVIGIKLQSLRGVPLLLQQDPCNKFCVESAGIRMVALMLTPYLSNHG